MGGVVSAGGAGGSITLEADAAYTEQGATAVDSVDGTLEVVITGSVGSAAGTYTLTYTATDAAGNSSQVQRMVTVLEPEPEPEPPPTGGGGNEADDQLVMTQGIVDGVWDRGINAFDQAIGWGCLLYTSPSPRDGLLSRMPSSA